MLSRRLSAEAPVRCLRLGPKSPGQESIRRGTFVLPDATLWLWSLWLSQAWCRKGQKSMKWGTQKEEHGRAKSWCSLKE